MIKKIGCLLSVLLLCSCAPKEIEFEEAFQLSLAVMDQGYADRFQQLWNQTYPEYQDKLEISVIDEETLFNLVSTDTEIPFDLYWINDSYVPYVIDNCLEYPKEFEDSYEVASFEAFSSTINAIKPVYSALTANGFFYAIDKNQLEEKNLRLEDFSSFETMANIENSFYYFNHSLYNLPLLSSDIAFFPGEEHSEIDFKSEAFLISKDNFQLIMETLDLQSDATSFDSWFIDQNYVSGLIADWMQAEENEIMNGAHYVYQKLPMIGEYQLKTAASSNGIVINANTQYPNAALLCLQLVHSKAGMQLLCVDEVNEYPLIPEEMIDEFTYGNEHIKEKALALNASFQESLVAVYGKEDVGALDYLDYDEVIQSILSCKDETCIIEIQENYEAWLTDE